MIEFFSTFVNNTWLMVARMAPYLILGFAVAGLLHVFMRPEAVKQFLGKPGLSAVFKACFIGVPMPLCSCAVIPVAASLRENGASRGATAAFVSSTPQTGIDSILATYALMGGPFTAIRVIVAFVSGIVTGFAIEVFCKEPRHHTHSTQLEPHTTCCSSSDSKKSTLARLLRYGFIELTSNLAAALILGLTLAGLITTLLPANLLSGPLSSGPLAFLLATLISLPLYICATASIPMAYALMAAGLSPGAALIFLITGPATNTATVITLLKIIGRKATFIYLVSLLAVSWMAGWLFNAATGMQTTELGIHHHEATEVALWQNICGIALILILFIALYVKKRPYKKTSKACCS